MGFDSTGIHPRQEEIHDFALARPFDTTHVDHRSQVRGRDFALDVQQLGTNSGHFLLVGGLVDLVANFCRLEHHPTLLQHFLKAA